jgi:RNA polymerase sigma factor (sigma-70 family)
MPRLEDFNKKRLDVRELKKQNIPVELLPLYQEPLLDRDQEFHEFRKFNYLKHQAKKILLTQKPTKTRLVKVKGLLAQTDKVRHQLVCSNTRLAAQVLHKRTDFYRAHSLMNDLLSDAYLNIVKAVECFDWTRGFKFSTYATWVLMNNFNRDLAGDRTFNEHFVTGFDDGIYDTRLDNSDEEVRDFEESRELSKQNVNRLLELLDVEEDGRKRYVIEEWFGLKSGQKRTLKDISHDLGLTKERVRQLRQRGLEYIRECLENDDVKLD